MTLLGAPFSGRPFGSRIVDEPIPLSPNGAFAGQSRPKPLLLDRPSGLLTPVNEAVFAPGLFWPLYQLALFALNICTGPDGGVCTPLAAKFGGTIRMPDPLGSIDRNEPSRLPSVMSGAPKFDRLPTRIRFGSNTAPGWVKAPGKPGGTENPGIGEANLHENGNEGGTGAVGPKNVP